MKDEAQTILAIETVLGDGSVSFCISGQEVAHVIGLPRPPLSETLLEITSELFRANGVGPETVDLVAVSLGPGSYTGIRVGVATALGFAYAIGSEVVGVSTLRALAESGKEVEGSVWVAIDAGREEVVSQQYELCDGTVVPRGGPELVEMKCFVQKFSKENIIVDLTTSKSLRASFPEYDHSSAIVASDNVANLLVAAALSEGTESDLNPIYSREFVIKTKYGRN